MNSSISNVCYCVLCCCGRQEFECNLVKRFVQVEPISQLAIELYISTLQTSGNELLVVIAEDNLQKTNFLFQALADGLNLATAYSIKGM